MAKHWAQYLPDKLVLAAPFSIYHVWRRQGWPLREVIDMWREAGEKDFEGPGFLGFKRTHASEFFLLAADREYAEATNWYCVNGCCTVTWGKRGNMGGFGPAGCSCGNLDDPRDIERGPIR